MSSTDGTQTPELSSATFGLKRPSKEAGVDDDVVLPVGVVAVVNDGIPACPLPDVSDRVRRQVHGITNFHRFIDNQVPYRIDPSGLNPGLVEYDGPLGDPDGAMLGGPNLHWRFDGVDYPIDRAIRIEYAYRRPEPEYASDPLVYASLLIGYVGVAGDGRWTRRAPVAASVDVSDLNAFIMRNFPPGHINNPNPGQFRAYQCDGQIYIAGLARDNDSRDPLPDTLSTVVRQTARYVQLMHWCVGDASYSVTKAIYVPYQYREGARGGALLIGFQGPGGH